MRHSTGKPTKDEQARMAAIKELGVCVACHVSGKQRWPQPVDVHHLLSGNRRRGHRYTVGLCGWHHRKLTDFGCTEKEMRDDLGPSLADGSKPFRAAFGSDDELLALQDALLHESQPLTSDSHDRY